MKLTPKSAQEMKSMDGFHDARVPSRLGTVSSHRGQVRFFHAFVDPFQAAGFGIQLAIVSPTNHDLTSIFAGSHGFLHHFSKLRPKERGKSRKRF